MGFFDKNVHLRSSSKDLGNIRESFIASPTVDIAIQDTDIV